MKKISIIVPETAVPSAILEPHYLFQAVNQFFIADEQPPFFDVQIVGLRKEVQLNGGLVSIHPNAQIEEVKQTDLIIIPAISGDIGSALQQNKPYLPWIVGHFKRGAEVASLCIGAFLLAETGLLYGKSCSTHWLFADAFRNMFPDVILQDDRVITDQNGIYSSGGATSYWNLLLYLVEKYTSREMAIRASKFFLLDIEKNSQSPFVIFKGQKSHADKQIVDVQEFIEEHFSKKLTVDELADKAGIGRRTFERRFKRATNNTVIEYLQRVKIEAAKKRLEMGRMTVNEVMYDVGYSDTKAFRDVFKKYTGMTPIDYRTRYQPYQ